MNCTNCGNVLEDNAKFCTKCGNSISVKNMNISQQPVNIATPIQQQPIYSVNPVGTTPKKNNVLTIILGIAVAVLVVMLVSTQYQLYEYKNRNAVDKTIDAIGSWLE